MRVILVLTFVAGAVLGIPTKEGCVPGTKFYRECNVCSCASDGLHESCTKMQCPPGEYDDAGRFLGPVITRRARNTFDAAPDAYSDKLKCEPSSVFRNSCNICVCNEDGTEYICTHMDCYDIGIGFNTDKYRRSIEDDSFSCVPGESYKDNCNSCVCDKSGKSGICTQLFCDPGPSYSANDKKVKRDLDVKLEYECEPRSTFKDDCNLCHCSESGEYAICTAMACVPGLNFGARFQKGQRL